MRAISILYHDVITGEAADSSGLPGRGAAAYKLPRENFLRHLSAIADTLEEPPMTATELQVLKPGRTPRLLTFDDGGVSAGTCIAEMLERHAWRASFFITTDYIGTPTFVDKQQIRDLRKQGHTIGSHSCSHPTRMSHCSWEELHGEWSRSTRILSDILGEEVNTASVPGGYYSRRVGIAAAESGIKVLFVSEPTTACHFESGCLVVGRYTIRLGMAPETAAGIAAGNLAPRLGQFAFWNLKKAAKALGGQAYLQLRARHFNRLVKNETQGYPPA